MRPPRHLSLVLPLALALAPSFALAQSAAGGAPAPARAAAAPPKPAAPPPAASAPRAGNAARPQAAPPRSSRRARKPKQKDAQPAAAGRPLATFPGFRMLPTGGSRIFVQVHGGKVDVAESKAAGRLVYRLKGTGAIQTNRFPLVTAFFATPVTRVQLVERGNDLDVVIDLRADTGAAYRVIETEQGSVLQVDFPAAIPEQRAAAPAEEARKRAVRRTIAQEPGTDEESSSDL
ncbi:hypothetical protein SOCE26_032870 [Sorangium cellulosum]|uniref:AMIN domain-containing protein n=1 Tax=Sorangium cellulosum TaxID=56 RepID=A0A2L0ERH5_SORCE|nr:hypothetical protein [Sorangium cellulosum]AUX41862.1 hypothetical protein SOCE26_032870 [Sorangium cellulosum]